MLEHIIVVEISSYYILVILIKRIRNPKHLLIFRLKEYLIAITGQDGTYIKLSLIREGVITGHSAPWFFRKIINGYHNNDIRSFFVRVQIVWLIFYHILSLPALEVLFRYVRRYGENSNSKRPK